MTKIEEMFLNLLKAGLEDREDVSDPAFSIESWEKVFRIASDQSLLPIILDCVERNPFASSIDFSLRKEQRRRALRQVSHQVVQTNEFLTLLLEAEKQGLHPIVLKGLIVRSLYPMPCLRPSVDEDVWVSREEVEAFHQFLLFQGLTPDDPEADLATSDEISYHRLNSPTYIEVHVSLFEPDSAAFGAFNGLFEGASEQAVIQQIEDVSVRTLEPTDHLLYLLCHVYKHFLHSGAGIRQVADIGMFAKAHNAEIDWDRVETSCREVHIDIFAAAIFKIIKKYLLPELATAPTNAQNSAYTAFSSIRTDEGPLLEDMLSGGIYGLSDPDRVHSANMTLTAAEASREGKGTGHGVLRSLFPSAAYLKNCFPYAKKHPILVPVAWAHRLYRYMKRTSGAFRSSMRTIRAGKKRIAMMKKYGIVE